jgi:acylphosphatase
LNGDVEALLAGPPDAVEALCAACWRGPVQARVDKVEIVEADPAALGPGAGFRHRPSSPATARNTLTVLAW